MNDDIDYALLDFGEGRKLERFGPVVLDRPSPAADGARRTDRARWKTADAVFHRGRDGEGEWRRRPNAPEAWPVAFGQIRFELRYSPAGHIGVFPEQAANWRWIEKQVRTCAERGSAPPRVLNLFAYTGGSTLAAAAAGAEVTHVDAAKTTVEKAKRNAELSGLADHPIRWIVDDARKFCEREVRRENFYDAVILDPPTYGHGARGEAWKIDRDLLPLLEVCRALTRERRAFLLASCHSPGFGPAELGAYLSEGIFGSCAAPPSAGAMELRDASGRRLPSGVHARWPK